MEAIGMPCRVAPQKIDESLRHGESAKDYVERLSREKAESALGEFCQSVIIGADTVVAAVSYTHLTLPTTPYV